MGRRTFARMARLLIKHGLPPDTQALLAEQVSLPEQRLIRSTVQDLAEQLASEEPGLSVPTLILFGSLAEANHD